jgi:DNA-binding Xre family transcriptional regulator
MTEVTTLVQTLRKTLSSRGIRYRDLAENLKVSEATIKRAFSKESFDLGRLAEICRFLNLSFFDLAKLARENTEDQSSRLTLPQEEALAADSDLFYLFCLVAKGTPISSIRRRKIWNERSLDRLVQTLARLKLAEWTSKTSLKVKAERNFNCNSNGPLYRAYGKSLKDDFLAADFTGDQEIFAFMTASLTSSAREDFLMRLRSLILEFQKLEKTQPFSAERPEHVCFMAGFRPWVFTPIREKIGKARP